VLRVSSLAACLILAGLCVRPAAGSDWTPGLQETKCGRDDWAARLGLFLGPQYFLEEENLVQFSFGAEGHLALSGPLSAGVSAGVGVIAQTTVLTTAGLRMHLIRSCELSLALDVRGGAGFRVSGDGTSVQPLVLGGLELAHDLGEMFCILVRTNAGYQGGEKRGWLLDLVVGLGLFL
jgi:hypothetical protein